MCRLFRSVCGPLSIVVGVTFVAATLEAAIETPVSVTPVQQAYLKASNTGSGDLFGWRVAVSGDTLVTTAVLEDSASVGVNGDQMNESAGGSGAAYIFVRTGTNWVQQAYVKPSNTPVCRAFGQSVAVDGDTVVIGAYGESSNATGVNGNQHDNSAPAAGAAYVFVRSGTNWTQQAYLKASNTDAGDQFGSSVAVSGDTIVVGAFQESSRATGVNGNQSDNSLTWAGAAYAFVRNGTNWSQQAYLKSANTQQFGQFGESAGISGDTIVIGANGEASVTGAAYIFERNGATWSQQAYLRAPNFEQGDNFGTKVAISGNTVAVAALSEDSNATGVNGDPGNNASPNSGAAYVFVRDGTTWKPQAYLKASNTGAGDNFGYAISLSGDLIVVGAPSEASNAIGINGIQSDNSATNSGAAYVYSRSGTNWSQRAYLKASNTGPGDFFGRGVAVSGDTVVVGAYAEDSGAIGINGDQNNDASTDSGAAYVFTGFVLRPALTLIPDGSGGYVIQFIGAPDVAYRLERATNLNGPWTTLTTLVAPASGMLEFHDTTAPASEAFYRTAQP